MLLFNTDPPNSVCIDGTDKLKSQVWSFEFSTN